MASKVVVITGCSSGIGMDTAVHLAKDDEKRFKVFATMRNLAKKDQLEKAAGSTMNETLFVRQLDVTKEDSIKEFMEKINTEGGVDILINNAGMFQLGVLETVTMEQIMTIYNTNVFGLIRVTQEVIPGMKAKKSGHIINVSSIAGLAGAPFCDIYVSSKFAVEGFSESIAPVLKKFNIRVSVIEPGPVKTDIIKHSTANNTVHLPGQTDSNLDELTQQLFATSLESLSATLSVCQTRAEIADSIKDIILSDKPHLHYITSEVFRKGLPGKKFIDITGDSVVEELTKLQNWKE